MPFGRLVVTRENERVYIAKFLAKGKRMRQGKGRRQEADNDHVLREEPFSLINAPYIIPDAVHRGDVFFSRERERYGRMEEKSLRFFPPVSGLNANEDGNRCDFRANSRAIVYLAVSYTSGIIKKCEAKRNSAG